MAISAYQRMISFEIIRTEKPLLYFLKQPLGFFVCATIASLSAGLFIGPQGFVLMWALLALLVVGIVWPWIVLKGLRCKLTFTEVRAFENSETLAKLEIKNHWPIPVYGLMVKADLLQDIAEHDDSIVTGLQRVPGWSESTYSWKVVPKRRGLLPTEPPTVSTGFPFGVNSGTKVVSTFNQTVVWPECTGLEGLPFLKSGRSACQDSLVDIAGFDGDTIGVREFRDGESMRYVHWAKSAQLDRLIVKELQQNLRQVMHIVLDLSPETHSGEGGQSSFEWAIRTAATICRQLHQNQVGVLVECTGLPKELRSTATNNQGLEPLLDFFSMLPSHASLLQSQVDTERIEYLPASLFEAHDQTILICTDVSKLKKESNSSVKEITILSESFGRDIDRDDEDKIDVSVGNGSSSAIVLTSPIKASDQLASGWTSPAFVKA